MGTFEVVATIMVVGVICFVVWLGHTTEQVRLKNYAECKLMAQDDYLPLDVVMGRMEWCFDKFKPNL